MTQPVQTAVSSQADRGWFGHPRGLSTLFFTEMWERFSFYGLRAILIFFITGSVASGGLGFSVEKGSAIVGWYGFGVYAAAIPGGWIADRFLGQYRSVFVGGVIIALGHFSMAFPSVATFYLGLSLIVVGTGLLKPNISTMVGSLYDKEDERRDAGFSIFYMGINVGASVAPFVVGTLGQRVGWHVGFGFRLASYQPLNPAFMIFGLAPLLAWLGLGLGPRQPSSPVKFALGLVFGGLGFALLVPASKLAQQQGILVSPLWLFGVYFLHTIGELCLSPVGLSIVTKLAPPRIVGAMMGVWFLSIAVGNKLAGWAAGFFDRLPLPQLFGVVALTTLDRKSVV